MTLFEQIPSIHSRVMNDDATLCLSRLIRMEEQHLKPMQHNILRGVHGASAENSLRQLENAGYVKRTVVGGFGGRDRYSSTPEGREAIREIAQ